MTAGVLSLLADCAVYRRSLGSRIRPTLFKTNYNYRYRYRKRSKDSGSSGDRQADHKEYVLICIKTDRSIHLFTMSFFTMPIIVLNMGGEMTYILNQRLQAQSVQDEKARKVLLDVARAMFSPVFIDELFKPQEMYSQSSTKQIFEKLAHSSIMRLNKSSMDKLYDLMTMGFKYQIISCNSPQQYLQVTLNHLESMKLLVGNEEAKETIQRAIDKSVALYTTLNNGQLILLKQSLFRFFQGKKIKVSLFLQQSLQNVDGSLVLSHVGELPYGTELPGMARYYEGASVAKSIQFDSVVKIGCTEVTDVINVAMRLGLNMYAKDGTSAAALPPAQAKALQESQAAALKALTSSAKHTSDELGLSGKYRQGITASSAKAELTMLADLLGGVGGSSLGAKGAPDMADAKESKPFKINLFPDRSGLFRPSDAKGEDGMSDFMDADGKESEQIIMIEIDGTADSKTFDGYMDDLNLKDEGEGAKAGSKGAPDDDDDDDLLALMDSAK